MDFAIDDPNPSVNTNDLDLLYIEPIDIFHSQSEYSFYGTAMSATGEAEYSNHQGGGIDTSCSNFATTAEDFVSDLPIISTQSPLALKGNNHAAFGHYQRRSSVPSDYGSSTGDLTYDQQESNTGNESSHRSVQPKENSFYSFYAIPPPQQEGATEQHWERQSAHSAPANVANAGNGNFWTNNTQAPMNNFGTTKSSSGVSLLNRNFGAMNCVSENGPSTQEQHHEQTGYYSHYSMSANETAPQSRSHLAHYAPSNDNHVPPSNDGLMMNFPIAEDRYHPEQEVGTTYSCDSRKRRLMSTVETTSCESVPVNMPSFLNHSLMMTKQDQPQPDSTEAWQNVDPIEIAKDDRLSFSLHTHSRRFTIPSKSNTLFDNTSVKSMPATMPSLNMPPLDTTSSFTFDGILSTPRPSVTDHIRDSDSSPNTLPETEVDTQTETQTVSLKVPKRKTHASKKKRQKLENEKLAAEQQWRRERTRILTQKDLKFGTKFSNAVLSEYSATTFTFSDRQGKRKGLHNGFPGLACYYCNGSDKVGGRYFPSTIKTMSDTNKTLMSIYSHLTKCERCPTRVQDNLSNLLVTHNAERQTQRYGSQKAFFTIIWDRLHGNGKLAME